MAKPDSAPARRQPSGALFIALGIIAIVMSMFFFLTYAINWSSAKHFQYEGREAQGQIEALSTSSTGVLYATYQYTDEFGTLHHGSDTYPLPDAANLKVGQALDIIYLRPIPDKSRIGAHQSIMMKTIADAPWIKIGSMAAGGLLSMAIGIRRRAKHRS